jgi:preprotein translocase subunit YajC
LWFFLIRPASRRQKELVRMQSALGVGDEVMLTSGVYGTVTTVADDHALVEVATGVVIKIARGAVGQIVTKAGDPDHDALEAPAEDGPADPTVDPAVNPADRPAGAEEN